MWTTIALIVLAAVALLVIVVATRPAGFRIARTIVVDAPAEAVFAHLDDFRAWRAWSPFEKIDPDTHRVFEGPPSGVGAIYRYAGNKAGQGVMTITDSVPARRLAIRAEFIKPFPAVSQVVFSLEPAAHSTAVTWTMTGTNSFVFKAFGLFFDMDRILGTEFEKGLADLKRVATASN